MGASMRTDDPDEDIVALATMTKDLLMEAVRLQVAAEHRNDPQTVERIAAFVAGVSATEMACLRTDAGTSAFLLSRLGDQHVH